MSHPVTNNSHSRHSYSPSRARYYAPPHPSQHPQMSSMWQPHLHHHHTTHHPSSRTHSIAAHHYHMSLARPEDGVRTAVDHPMYPSADRRDPSDLYAHRHRASYPPLMHPPIPGHYGGVSSWKNAHYEGKEHFRHDETRKVNGEGPPPVTKMADKTATSEPTAQMVTINGKEERATPGGTRKAAALLEEKFQQSLKSPVTMCFERFLGAGTYFGFILLNSVKYL